MKISMNRKLPTVGITVMAMVARLLLQHNELHPLIGVSTRRMRSSIIVRDLFNSDRAASTTATCAIT